LTDINQVLTEGKSQEEQSLERRVVGYQRKVKDLTQLLDQHKYLTPFFDILAKATHPKVYFSDLRLNTQSGIVELLGKTENFETLSQQHSIFQKTSLFDEVKLSRAVLSKEGKLEFAVSLVLNPGIFEYDSR
jgi:hypothetical protein